jgi:hypothetical protein
VFFAQTDLMVMRAAQRVRGHAERVHKFGKLLSRNFSKKRTLGRGFTAGDDGGGTKLNCEYGFRPQGARMR